jgi:hypothetical protein
VKIISQETTRVTTLFPLEEIVPIGGVTNDIVEKIKEKYKFFRVPDLSKPREEINKNGYKFESGEFHFEGRSVIIMEFGVYSDGLVVVSHTTERGEAFLDDVIKWMRKDYGFREFETEPRRYFQSQVVVEFDRPFGKLISALTDVINVISEPLEPIYRTKDKVGFCRLDLEYDKATSGISVAVTRFILERRANIPYEKERYYSAAPMRSADHLRTLEKIESILG